MPIKSTTTTDGREEGKKKKNLKESTEQIKTVQQKYSTIDWPGKQREPEVMSTRMKLTKAQTGKQN